MKRLKVFLSASLLALLSNAVLISAAHATPSNAPTAVITGVSVTKDERTLLIRYDLSGHSHEQSVAFTNNITDFRYCRWVGERGVAIVASTRADEFYYATLYLTRQNSQISPVKIPAPTGSSRLLGIANTGGDSIVITAVQHQRGTPERLSGWMFIDNCPPVGANAGSIIPFDLALKTE